VVKGAGNVIATGEQTAMSKAATRRELPVSDPRSGSFFLKSDDADMPLQLPHHGR
jgi:hypothetical protein